MRSMGLCLCMHACIVCVLCICNSYEFYFISITRSARVQLFVPDILEMRFINLLHTLLNFGWAFTNSPDSHVLLETTTTTTKHRRIVSTMWNSETVDRSPLGKHYLKNDSLHCKIQIFANRNNAGNVNSISRSNKFKANRTQRATQRNVTTFSSLN